MKAKRFVCALTGLALCLSLSACKEEALEPVSVQSVGMITGMGSVGLAERFAAVVDAGESVKVEKDSQLQVKEILVAVGDQVEEGQPLFTYDVQALSLSLDKMRLELEQMKAASATKTTQMEELEKEKAKAKSEEQLGYTLQIQELQIDLTESALKIAEKEKEVSRTEALMENDKVLSPASGRVKEINQDSSGDDYGYGYGYDRGDSEKPFMSIQQTEGYRLKGKIDEMNLQYMQPGMAVTIRSRLDDSFWTGVVEDVDMSNPAKENNEYGYIYGGSSDEMSNTSKYYFYVALDDDTDMKLGQHVYVEPGLPSEDKDKLMLPAWCISDADSDPWVWAVNEKEKLEKRSLKLGKYDEEQDSYEVLSGIGLQDYLAPPAETCKEGAPVVYYSESDFDAPDVPVDFGGFGGEDFGGDDFGGEDFGGEIGGDFGGDDFGDYGDDFGGESGEGMDGETGAEVQTPVTENVEESIEASTEEGSDA